jgi:hypothetical protein
MGTMKCERCGVDIAEGNVAKPNRCVDWRCPTMPDDLRRKPPEEKAKVECVWNRPFLIRKNFTETRR